MKNEGGRHLPRAPHPGARGTVSSYRAAATAGKERKYYHLTRRGEAALKKEAEAWKEYAGAVNAVLRSSAGLSPA